MNDQERFEAWLKEAAKEHYNVPPESPRDRIWDAVEAERSETRAAAEDQRVLSLSSFRSYPTWLKIAAALVIGLGLGRLTMVNPWSAGAGDQPAAVARADVNAGASAQGAGATLPYRIAAQEHLDRTEALLTGFRSSARDSATRAEIGPWARGLLAHTRLLLDSPASEDAELASLLGDLEFVLAQIVQLRDSDDEEELGFIDEGLEERQVLLRIQTVAARSPARL